jgi:hypothetical protein
MKCWEGSGLSQESLVGPIGEIFCWLLAGFALGATQKIKFLVNSKYDTSIGRNRNRTRTRESAIACHAMPRDQLALRAAATISDFSNRLHFFCFTHKQTALYFTIPQDALRPSSPPLDLPTYLPTFLPTSNFRPLANSLSRPRLLTLPDIRSSNPAILFHFLPSLNTILICAPPETDLRTGKLLLFRCTIPSTSSSRVHSLSPLPISAFIHLRCFFILLILYSRKKE